MPTSQRTQTSDLDRPHAVIRFKRDFSFPRFSMKAGERWGFVVFGKHVERLRQIKAGERFEFAGGQCLAEDVEVIYEGPPGIEYSIAAGYIQPLAAAPAILEAGAPGGESADDGDDDPVDAVASYLLELGTQHGFQQDMDSIQGAIQEAADRLCLELSEAQFASACDMVLARQADSRQEAHRA